MGVNRTSGNVLQIISMDKAVDDPWANLRTEMRAAIRMNQSPVC